MIGLLANMMGSAYIARAIQKDKAIIAEAEKSMV